LLLLEFDEQCAGTGGTNVMCSVVDRVQIERVAGFDRHLRDGPVEAGEVLGAIGDYVADHVWVTVHV